MYEVWFQMQKYLNCLLAKHVTRICCANISKSLKVVPHSLWIECMWFIEKTTNISTEFSCKHSQRLKLKSFSKFSSPNYVPSLVRVTVGTGNRGLGLGSALAPTILMITSSGVTGDPPKGVKGTLTPLTFKNVQIHLSCLMFNNYGPPKQNGARIAYERRPQRGRLFRWYFRVILMTTYLQYICPSLFHTYIGWVYGLLARHSALWCPSYLLSIIVRRESVKIENVKIATICSDVVLN